MRILAYDRVSFAVLDEVHYTKKTGAAYSLRQKDILNVEMPFRGQGVSRTNSQGWLRDSNYYFSKLRDVHPELISKKNGVRIDNKEAPIVDARMVKHIPEWEPYIGQSLIHHHVGGDGEAVAVPEEIHPGFGEIHNHEKAAGITDECKSFSNYCNDTEGSVGKTTSDLWENYQTTENSEKSDNDDSLNTIDEKHPRNFTEGTEGAYADGGTQQEEQSSDLTGSAEETPAEENTEQEEQAGDLLEDADESPAEESAEQEEQASDLTECVDESPAEESTEQEEQASDLGEGTDEVTAEKSAEQENQSNDLGEGTDEVTAEKSAEQEDKSSDLTEGADESLAEYNTEQEEKTNDLTEDVDTESTQNNEKDAAYSEENESDESQSYGY